MKSVISELKAWGCDMDGALARFLNDEDLYISFLDRMANDEGYAQLGDALKVGDVKKAFECAHTLKGALGNMGLTPLYELSIEIVEPLRSGITQGVPEKYELLLERNERFKQIISK